MGENFRDWDDRGENGGRVGENMAGLSPGSPRSPTFPFPLTLGQKLSLGCIYNLLLFFTLNTQPFEEDTP